MDVYLMIRRGKLTLFLDAKETTTVLELKKMIEGITKQPVMEQKLYNREDMVRGGKNCLCLLILPEAG